MKKEKWEEVALENHVFLDDVHNKSVAMTLGLLSKQDIVISGGFTVRRKNIEAGITKEDKISKDKEKGPKKESQAAFENVVTVRTVLLDISKKTIISEFTSEAVVDNRIFASIDKLAAMIAEKAKVVLPNKEDWQGKSLEESKPLFDKYIIGTRAGAGIFFLGLADRISFTQPALSFFFQAHIPKLWNKSFVEISAAYFSYTPEKNKNLAIDRFNVIG